MYRAPDDAAMINEALRAGLSIYESEKALGNIGNDFDKDDCDFYQSAHEIMLEYAHRKPLTEYTVMYRGCKMASIPDVGESFIDKGWMSTSKSRNTAEMFAVSEGDGPNWTNEDRTGYLPVLLIVNAKAGTPAVDTEHDDVEEIVVAPDVEFEVIGRKQTQDYWMVEIATMLPGEE